MGTRLLSGCFQIMFVHMLIPEFTGARCPAAGCDANRVCVTTLLVVFMMLTISMLAVAGTGLQAAAVANSLPPTITSENFVRTGDEQESERDARELLLNAKDALSSGDIRYLRTRLGGKVYLNLFTGINSYYSAEQAYLILASFFSTYTPISFSFSSRNFSIRNPYGFGPLTFERRGRRGNAEMFISLAQVGERWVINQITVASR